MTHSSILDGEKQYILCCFSHLVTFTVLLETVGALAVASLLVLGLGQISSGLDLALKSLE